MYLVEQIHVRPSKELSHLCHLAKNLYNAANFQVRQFYFNLEEVINYYDLQVILKSSTCYKELPPQSAQQVLKLVYQNWRSYFASLKEYKVNPKKFLGKPKPPKYKKKDGESILNLTNQSARIKSGYIHFPKKCNLFPIKTRIQQYQQVRIVPQGAGYVVEIVYNRAETDLGLNKGNVVGIDLGLNNLITAVNNKGLQPFIIKGGVVKSVNQFYNKVNASLQGQKDKQNFEFQTKKQGILLSKRNNKIQDIFHKVSCKVITYCIQHDIGTIVIGYNEGWKQGLALGKRNNQNFTQVPFAKLIQMVAYKAQLVGIQVMTHEEGYTSKCSFPDGESIEKHDTYSGRRIKRGLFRTARGIVINADVNAGFNILRKAVPEAIGYGIEAVALQPYSIEI